MSQPSASSRAGGGVALTRTYSEDLDGSGLSIGIAVSRFNTLITERLLAGVLETLAEQGVAAEGTAVAWVPGSFELPYAARQLIERGEFDAIICLGCVIKGETTHNEYINQQVARGIAEVSLSTGVPVIFGVLTPDNLQQALERVGGEQENKGREFALSAIVMGNLRRRLAEP